MAPIKFTLSKAQVVNLIPLFTLLKSLEGENAKTFWYLNDQQSKLIISGLYFNLLYHLPLQSAIENPQMFEVDFEKMIKVLHSVIDADIDKDPNTSIQISISNDKMLFHDTGSARIKTRLPSISLTPEEQEGELQTIPRLFRKFFEENQPYHINLTPSLLQSFKIATRGITTTATRNNSIVVYPESCLYADLAQLYIMPKPAEDDLILDGPSIKLHRVSMQLLNQIIDLMIKLNPESINIYQAQVSSNGFYVYFNVPSLVEIMITQRVTYLDIPDDNTLGMIAPSADDPRAIKMIFDVDSLSRELKMYTNIPSQESKRWGAIQINFDSTKGNTVHFSLYDYVAEVESDFDAISISYPEGFGRYSCLWSTKLVDYFMGQYKKSQLVMYLLPEDSGPQSIGIVLEGSDGKKAIYPKFNGRVVGSGA